MTITEHQSHTKYLHSIKTRELQERKRFESFCLRAERRTWSMALAKQADRLSDIELLECRPELIDGVDEDHIRIDVNHSIDIQNTLDEEKNCQHRSPSRFSPVIPKDVESSCCKKWSNERAIPSVRRNKLELADRWERRADGSEEWIDSTRTEEETWAECEIDRSDSNCRWWAERDESDVSMNDSTTRSLSRDVWWRETMICRNWSKGTVPNWIAVEAEAKVSDLDRTSTDRSLHRSIGIRDISRCERHFGSHEEF